MPVTTADSDSVISTVGRTDSGPLVALACAAIPAIATARIAVAFESGPAIAKLKELFHATTKAIRQQLIIAARRPAGRCGDKGPEKIRAP